jgi:hypothetical protein
MRVKPRGLDAHFICACGAFLYGFEKYREKAFFNTRLLQADEDLI